MQKFTRLNKTYLKICFLNAQLKNKSRYIHILGTVFGEKENNQI